MRRYLAHFLSAIDMSSLGTESTVEECLKKGAKSFVQKPIEKKGMLATLTSVCEQAGVEL
ncbi:MAG: hypothetical protein EXR70_23675 [Deltaproteobacteria bacterium]|nr:hypothetical protein [Deltaproteobacteria bacterium]